MSQVWIMYFGPWAPHNVTFWGPPMTKWTVKGQNVFENSTLHESFVILVLNIEYFKNPMSTTRVPLDIFRNTRFCCYGNQTNKLAI